MNKFIELFISLNKVEPKIKLTDSRKQHQLDIIKIIELETEIIKLKIKLLNN